MNEPSPFQPPLPQGPASIPPALIGVPPAVNVLGIMHLVFAGLGIMSALWGLVIVITGNPFLTMTSGSPEMAAQLQAQIAMQEKINPMTITSSVLSLLVAIPMIIAGIALVKKRRKGLKWSNIYAWSSLGAKVINLVLAITIMVPAMQEMAREMFGKTPVPASVTGVMSGFMAAGAIGGVVISAVYPIVTLVLLNRPATKSWFASLSR